MAVRMDGKAPLRRGGTLLACLLASLLGAGAAQAQVYKWVDEKGKTHYSNNPDDANRNKSQQVRITAAPKSSPAPAPAAPPPPRTELPMEPPGAGPARPPRSVSGGREDGTDASRCALARDILNGSLKHANGKPIDKYDRDVATSDVKLFCK